MHVHKKLKRYIAQRDTTEDHDNIPNMINLCNSPKMCTQEQRNTISVGVGNDKRYNSKYRLQTRHESWGETYSFFFDNLSPSC